MLARAQDEISRYAREEQAREVLRGARVYVVDAKDKVRDIDDALSWAGAEVVRFTNLLGAARSLCGARRADALALDLSATDHEGRRQLARADPELAVFLHGGGPKAAARLRHAYGRDVPILERPAARYEQLEFTAEAVLTTRCSRRGRGLEPGLAALDTEPHFVLRPQPDHWSCALLRRRICYWSAELQLTERETQVMRGAVRGLKNKEIARQLGLSIHAVKKYLRELLHKLGLESRHEVAWLLERTPMETGAPLDAVDR